MRDTGETNNVINVNTYSTMLSVNDLSTNHVFQLEASEREDNCVGRRADGQHVGVGCAQGDRDNEVERIHFNTFCLK